MSPLLYIQPTNQSINQIKSLNMAAKFSIVAQINTLERTDKATEDVMQKIWAHGGLMKKRLTRSMMVLTLLLVLDVVCIPLVFAYVDNDGLPPPMFMGIPVGLIAGAVLFNAILVLAPIGFMSYNQLLARYYVVSHHRAELINDLIKERALKDKMKEKSSSKRKNRKIE